MNNTAAIQNASYAARPTSPQLRNARNASRCRTWFDAEEENALATLSRRKEASHHHPSRMINTFQLSPVKGTHALKNWTHRPHPAPEAVPDPEGDPDPGDAPYPGGAPDPEDGQRPEGRESASIPEAALGLTAAPGPVPDPEGTRLERFLDRREPPPGLILSVDDQQR